LGKTKPYLWKVMGYFKFFGIRQIIAKWYLLLGLSVCSFLFTGFSNIPQSFQTTLTCLDKPGQPQNTVSYKTAINISNTKELFFSFISSGLLLFYNKLSLIKLDHITRLFNTYKAKLGLFQLQSTPRNLIGTIVLA
jgi:hypothetical protein